MSQSETNTSETEYYDNVPIYPDDSVQTETEKPEFGTSFFVSSTDNIATDTEADENTDTTTNKWSPVDLNKDNIPTTEAVTELITNPSIIITTNLEPETISEAITTIKSTIATEKNVSAKLTPAISLLPTHTISIQELVTQANDISYTYFTTEKMTTTQRILATTDAYQQTIQTEPFSTFLKKLLIMLCVKRSTDLRVLMEAFLIYVQELLNTGQLDVLGTETKTFMNDVILIINDSTIYMLRYDFGEVQLMLVNRDKNKDDLLSYMDDMFEVAEEEAMQKVLNDVTLYPNGNKTARRIARWFVRNVFLKPINRVANTKEGDKLFAIITENVESINSYKTTKQSLRQNNFVKTKATPKYVDLKFNIDSHNDRKRIINNIQSIENLLREGHTDDEYDIHKILSDENASDDISEKNNGFKPAKSSEEIVEEVGGNQNEYSNQKSISEDKYEPHDEYKADRYKFPISVGRNYVNRHLNTQVKQDYVKNKKNGKLLDRLAPKYDEIKRLQLSHQDIKVGLTKYNPYLQNTKIKHKMKNTLNKSKMNMENIQRRYKILKTNNKNHEEEYLNKKDIIGDGTDKSSSLSSDEKETSDERQIKTEVQKPTNNFDRKVKPYALHTKFPFVKKIKASRPILHKNFLRPENVITNKSSAKLWPHIHYFNDQLQRKYLYEEEKREKHNYEAISKNINVSGMKFNKDNNMNKNKVNIINIRKKNKNLPEYRERKYFDELGSLIFTEKSRVWSGKHSFTNFGNYDDDLRLKNGDGDKLPDEYRLTTRYRGEERKLQYRLQTKPNKSLEFYRRYYRKKSRDGNTATDNTGNVFKVKDNGEMIMEKDVHDFLRHVDFVEHNGTRTPLHDSTSMLLLEDDSYSYHTDEEAVLKTHIYKAMRKL